MIQQERIDVGDSEAVEVTADEVSFGQGQDLLIRNLGEDPVYLGNADVTATDGYELEADATITLRTTDRREKLYAICDTGDTTTLAVLRSGV